MRTLLRAAVAAVFLFGAVALVAWWLDGTQAFAGVGARAGDQIALDPGLAKRVDARIAPAAAPPSPELMVALMAWAAPRLGLPVPAILPRVVRKSHCELQAIAYDNDDCPPLGQGALALYDANVLWLRDDWRGDNIRDVSILLHELIHHMQFHAGVEPLPCQAQALERPAYEAQFAFLEAAGVDAHEAIGINDLMLVFVTTCLGRH